MPISQQKGKQAETTQHTRHPVIAVEGIDGCGKTTIAKQLAEAVCGHHYATPPEPYREIRRHIDCSCSRLEHLLFYAAALIRASREIEALSQLGPVVVDRYVASTIAYHAHWLDGELRLIDHLHVVLPAATVLLVAGESTRLSRLSARDGTTLDSWFDSAASRQCALDSLRRYATFEVDASNSTPAEIVAHIIAELQRRRVL